MFSFYEYDSIKRDPTVHIRLVFPRSGRNSLAQQFQIRFFEILQPHDTMVVPATGLESDGITLRTDG